MNQEKIAETIRKLLALSTSPNEHEAAAAMSKAQELLTKYNLDLGTIKTNGDNESVLINEVVDFDGSATWEVLLLDMVAMCNYCRVIRMSKTEHRILGRRANVQSVEVMHNWLEPQIIRLAIKSGYTRADKRTYIFGVINNLKTRLQANMQEYKSKNPQSVALIVNIQGEADNWFKHNFPHTTKRATSSSGSRGAYSQGQRDGGGISLGSSGHVTGGRLMLA